MRSRSLARSLALFLAVAPGAALADPPPPPPATPAPDAPKPAAPAQPAPAPQPAPTAAKPAAPKAASPKTVPPLPKAGTAPATAKPAKGIARGKTAALGKKKGKKDKKDAPVTGPVATYPGFRMLDGGASRVFVTLSKKVAITETKAAGKLTYKIQGVQVPTRTNRLALLTTYFATPVTSVELTPHDADVDLVIDVKDATGATYRIVETDKGAELQVDFPKIATDPADKPAATDGGSAAAQPSEGRPTTEKRLDSKADSSY